LVLAGICDRVASVPRDTVDPDHPASSIRTEVLGERVQELSPVCRRLGCYQSLDDLLEQASRIKHHHVEGVGHEAELLGRPVSARAELTRRPVRSALRRTHRSETRLQRALPHQGR
jgi:hypothetical protein